jgi:hypothetical protein
LNVFSAKARHFCSWIPHCPTAGKPIAPEGEPTSYRAYAKEVAEKEKTPFVDQYALVWHHYMKQNADLRSGPFILNRRVVLQCLRHWARHRSAAAGV